MNDVLAQAEGLARHGWIVGIITIVFIVCFAGWVAWTFASRNRERMEEAARLPLTEDEP